MDVLQLTHTIRNIIISGLEHLTNYLRQWVAFQVQQNRPCLKTRPELEKTVQGQRGHVWFTPPLSSFLYLLLEFHPPGGRKKIERKNTWWMHNFWAFFDQTTLLCWWFGLESSKAWHSLNGKQSVEKTFVEFTHRGNLYCSVCGLCCIISKNLFYDNTKKVCENFPVYFSVLNWNLLLDLLALHGLVKQTHNFRCNLGWIGLSQT